MEKPVETNDPTHRKRRLLLLGATGVAGALTVSGCLIATAQHNKKAEAIPAVASNLARNRNTCSIDSLKPTTRLGKPALTVVIDITEKDTPQSLNKKFDGLGMDTTFKDEKGNLVSGIMVSRRTHEEEPYSIVLGRTKGDGPTTKTNSMVLTEPVISSGPATYDVYRQNAIDFSVTGLLVDDKNGLAQSAVRCGSFTYVPGTLPVIVQQ